jgi:archaellin
MGQAPLPTAVIVRRTPVRGLTGLNFLWIAFVVLSAIAFFAILFTSAASRQRAMAAGSLSIMAL